jgi:ribosomal protein L22
MHALEDELRLSPEEFAGIARRATGKEHSSASKDIQKVIEALKAIAARRRRAAIEQLGNQAMGQG